MNKQSRVIGTMLTSLSAACSTSGGHADFDLKQVPGIPIFASEEDFTIFQNKNHGDASGVNQNTWTGTTVIRNYAVNVD